MLSGANCVLLILELVAVLDRAEFSPLNYILFFVDNLLQAMSDAKIGYIINGISVNLVCFTDDLCIMSVSLLVNNDLDFIFVLLYMFLSILSILFILQFLSIYIFLTFAVLIKYFLFVYIILYIHCNN